MTYRVVDKWISRMEDGQRVRYQQGETFEPTDAELQAYGDRLEEVSSDSSENVERVGSGESESSSPTPTRDDEKSSVEEFEQSESEGKTEDSVSLESMEYQDLQQLAAKYPDISGRQTEEELKSQLSEKV